MTFSEKLLIPYTEEIETGVIPEPLLNSKAFEKIQTAYDTSSKAYTASLATAHEVAALIHDNITFRSQTADQPELSPESLNDLRATNCHGHSIIVSECLEELGIDHRIGFANLHSFILLTDNESGRVDMIDTPDTKLWREITPALGDIALTQLDESIGGANHLHGNRILEGFSYDEKQRVLSRRPWLSFTADRNNIAFYTPEQQDRASQLLMRHYAPKVGREMLFSFTNFAHAVISKDTPRAHTWLQPLNGIYPDIEKRNKLRGVTRLVRDLGNIAAGTGKHAIVNDQLVEETLNDIEIVEHSITPFTTDLILNIWPIDERRALGMKIKSADKIRETLKEYDKLLTARKEANLSRTDIENRIRAAESQLAKLG